MYTPPAFRDEDRDSLLATIRAARLATFVTATAEGPLATPLPLFIDASEGEHGVLYGHLAKANPQWRVPAIGNGLAIFAGPDAYVTPSWYALKQETGKVVPTWNYVAVHASGPVEFFDDPARLLDVVTRLTDLHEGEEPRPGRSPTRRPNSSSRTCAASSACACRSRRSKASASSARTAARRTAPAWRRVSPRASGRWTAMSRP